MDNLKKEISRRNYKAGYTVIHGIIDGKEFCCDDFEIKWAVTKSGDYIGDPKTAHMLCKEKGIAPEKRPGTSVCSIGFCQKDNKWYGWSHRAICSFGVGDVVKEGDCTTESGYVDDYLKEFPEKDFRLPVGFTAKNLDDAKRMAIAFADSVR